MASSNSNQLFNDAFWHFVHSSPADCVFFKALGIVLGSIVTCAVWTNTVRYYEYFGTTDKKWALGVIGFGCAIVTANLALDLAQVHGLSFHAYTDYLSVMHFDQTADTIKAIIATILSFIANCFYSWRVYKLSGERRIILCIVVLVSIGVYSFTFFVNIYALCAPKLDLSDLTTGLAFLDKLKKYYLVSGAMSMAHDLTLCISMIALLWRTKNSLFNLETRVFNKIAAITFESMLPPVICIMIIDPTGWAPGSDTITVYYGWNKIFWPPLGPLYFLSLLMSLISRRSVRQLLNENLTSNGISRLGSMSGSTGKQSFPEAVVMTVERTSAVHKVEPRTVRINRQPLPEDIPMDSMEDVHMGNLDEKEWKTSIRTASLAEGGSGGNEYSSTHDLGYTGEKEWDVEAHPRRSMDSNIPPFTGVFYGPDDGPEVAETGVHPFVRSAAKHGP